MGLRFIFGRSGTGKTTFCFNKIAEKVSSSNKIYIITPEQFSFTTEKKLLNVVKTKAVINAEVLTFERMAYRIINEIGMTNKVNLSEAGKLMLLYSILDENKNKLKILGRTQKNLDVILKIINEFKKHNINNNILKDVKPKINNKRLEYKLEDINTLLNSYEQLIKDNFIDDNDLLTILYENIDKVDVFKNTIIYIDEFSGFTKQEYLILEKLLKLAKNVYISICTDNQNLNTNPYIDVFYSNKICINRIIKIAKNHNIKIEEPIVLEKKYRFKTEEIYEIEEFFSKNKKAIYEKDVNNIKLFLANNEYNEIEYVANNIAELVRNSGYKYNEIAIITKDISKYSGIIKAIFNKYDIPIFIDEKQDLSQNILVKYIIAILDVFAKNWSIESVFNYVKSGFLNLEQEDIFILENYCKSLGIKGFKKYTNEWNIYLENYDLNKLNELRKIIVKPLLDLKLHIKNNNTIESITKSLYNFLIKNEINEKINKKIEKFESIGKLDLANIYSNSWNIIVNLLDEIIIVLGNKKISFEKYIDIFKIGLAQSSLGKIPATLDEVIIGDIDRSRNSDKKAIFIIGLNDGVFPSNNKNEGFIDDEERENLKNNGIELAKTLKEQTYDENFNIYKAFTSASEKLYLSYCASDSEGKTLRKSILINRIRKIFIKLKEENELTNNNKFILYKKTTFDMLIINLRKFLNGETIDNIWFELYNIYIKNILYKNKLEDAISGFYYSNTPDRINEENLKKLYGDTLVTSISKLEAYRKCAFSYYIKYGLKLSDKTVFKLESLDTGTFMHEVIDEFFNYINSNNIDLKNIEEKEIEEILNNIIDIKLNLSKNYIFKCTKKYIVLTNRLKKVVKMSIKYIIDTIRFSDFNIYGNEIEFGKGKEYEPIEISLSNNQRVQITGKIDRVDIAENEDSKYIRIIDYKSSIKNLDLNEVITGIQIQLLTYLDAISIKQDANPAGVLYFNLIDPIIKVKQRNISDEELEEQIKNNFKMNGLILGDVKVVQMMDNNLVSGGSKVIPAYIDKNGNISKAKSNTLDLVEFKVLQNQINKILKQISKEILTGIIEPNPVYISKKKVTPCLYCNYKPICGFNPELKGNNYKYIPNFNKNEILNKLKEN